MAESHYSADSARNPDLFPHPLMPGASSQMVFAPVADGRNRGACHSPAPVDIAEPAETAPTSIIKLHN